MTDDLKYGLFGSESVFSNSFGVGTEPEPLNNEPMLFGDDNEFDFGFDSVDTGSDDYSLPDSDNSSSWVDPDSNDNGSDKDNGSQSPVKIAIIAIVAGLILIIIVFILLRFTGNSKTEQPTQQQQQVVQQTQIPQQQTQIPQQQVITQQTIPQQQVVHQHTIPQQQVIQPVQQPTTNSIVQEQNFSSDSGWVEINDRLLSFNDTIQSTFTVERTKVYAKQNGTETNVKAVAVGKITGLTGEYELEVPYSGLDSLSVGTILTVEYQYLTSGNTKVITAIKFI